MIYYIRERRHRDNEKTAGGKAPADVEEICQQCGYAPLTFPQKVPAEAFVCLKIKLTFSALKSWAAAFARMRRGDTMIFQYPMCAMPLAMKALPMLKRKGVRLIALIHDLAYIRMRDSGCGEKSLSYYRRMDEALRNMDVIICHNDNMKRYLEGEGYAPERIVCLRIFDYLCHEPQKRTDISFEEQKTIAIAGNLSPKKSGYVSELSKLKPTFRLNLYGIGYKPDSGDERTVHYCGAYLSEELPSKLNGSFGLVWDGPKLETCYGHVGNYLRLNAPHKLSAYLAADMPVIIWKEAAMADFVAEHHVGIAIDSLYELERILSELSASEYDAMRQSAQKIGARLRSGFYTQRALNRCFEIIQALGG